MRECSLSPFALHSPYLLFQIQVNLNDLSSFSKELCELLVERPGEYLSIFESAACSVAAQVTAQEDTTGQGIQKVKEVQVQLINYPRLTQIRNLASDHVGKVCCC